jgi:hypothetical protein
VSSDDEDGPGPREHRALVLWAVGCAERVLPHFEEANPGDDRPRKALEAGRAWAREELGTGAVREAALAAHAAAREVRGAAAVAAARACGHAAATAHVAGHAGHAAEYAVKAVVAASDPAMADHVAEAERDWQRGADPDGPEL